MSTIESELAIAVPEQGNLVRVRDRLWVVESVQPSSQPRSGAASSRWTLHHLVRLAPVDDRGSAERLSVFWEAEPGVEIRPQSSLPDPHGGVDDPATFAAFLDAVRWGAVASADPRGFQAPFRAGIEIEDYQLLPLVRSLRMPRVGLLIADDVGLGKTVEAGLIAQELVLRNQARRCREGRGRTARCDASPLSGGASGTELDRRDARLGLRGRVRTEGGARDPVSTVSTSTTGAWSGWHGSCSGTAPSKPAGETCARRASWST